MCSRTPQYSPPVSRVIQEKDNSGDNPVSCIVLIYFLIQKQISICVTWIKTRPNGFPLPLDLELVFDPSWVKEMSCLIPTYFNSLWATYHSICRFDANSYSGRILKPTIAFSREVEHQMEHWNHSLCCTTLAIAL